MVNLGNHNTQKEFLFCEIQWKCRSRGKPFFIIWQNPWRDVLSCADYGIKVKGMLSTLASSLERTVLSEVLAIAFDLTWEGKGMDMLLSSVLGWVTARVVGDLSLPAAPAMCSSMLSRSSQAAGWMSPYISSVRIGAALMSRDKGAGDRLITWEEMEITS